jgi:hypothetical protein
VELGLFLHPAEGEMVYRSTNEKVPYFNAPVFLENKTPVGKVDEIFGPTTEMVSGAQRARCGVGSARCSRHWDLARLSALRCHSGEIGRQYRPVSAPCIRAGTTDVYREADGGRRGDVVQGLRQGLHQPGQAAAHVSLSAARVSGSLRL